MLSECFCCYMRCMCAQATCLIKSIKDIRGTVIQGAYEARCREPGDACPEECQQPEDNIYQRICYKCHIPAICEGLLSSHAV